MISPWQMRTLESDLSQLGVQTDFKTYPNCDHAFFCDDHAEPGGPYDAEDAWGRMLGFLRTHLADRWHEA